MPMWGSIRKRLKAMDLRFQGNLEKEFKLSLVPSFFWPVHAGLLATFIAVFRSQYYLGIDLADSMSLCMVSRNAFGLLLVVLGLCLMIPAVRKLCHLDLELSVVVGCVCGLACNCCGMEWYVAQYLGRDPREIFGDQVVQKEASMLMVFCICVNAASVALPIRFHMLLVLPTLGSGMACAVRYATSSAEPQWFSASTFYTTCLLCFSLLGGYRTESFVRREWLAQRQIEKQAEVSEKQRQGFALLLNRLCDCLLILGPNFEMLEPCPNLRAMLFLSDNQELHGSCFCDYIAHEEDRASFLASVGRGSSQDGPAGILPLNLRDSHSREVQVHLYFTWFHDTDDSPHYIIGIAEAGTQEEERNAKSGDNPGLCQLVQSADDVNSESGSSISLEAVPDLDSSQVLVTFDAFDFTISSCTTGLTALCGPVADLRSINICDWIVKPSKFEKSIMDLVNTVCANIQLDCEPIVLRAPQMIGAGLEHIISSCIIDTISCSWPNEEDEVDARCQVQMRFNDIRCKSPDEAAADLDSCDFSATVDALSFDVICCTPSFAALLGPLPELDIKIVDYIVEPNRFIDWVQALVKEFMAEHRKLVSDAIVLRIPCAVGAEVEYVARSCVIDTMTCHQCEEVADSRVSIKMRLDGIQQRLVGRRRRRRSRSGGQSWTNRTTLTL